MTRCFRALIPLIAATLLAGGLAPTCWAKKKKEQEQVLPTVHCHEVLVLGEVAYLAQTSGLTLLDVTDPSKPRALGSLGIPATLTGVAVEGPVAYLSAGAHGLYIVDVENPDAPVAIQRFDTPGRVMQVLVRNGLAYLADSREGLKVVDVSNPQRPIHKARFPTRETVRAIALQGERLAVAEGRAGVRLYQLRRDGLPTETGLLRDLGNVRDVAFLDDLLLVAAADRGLLVYELGEQEPRLLSEVAPLRSAEYVTGMGALALISNGAAEIQIIDLSEPGAPREPAAIRAHRSYPAGRINTAGRLAYVATDLAGMVVLDLGDPELPATLYPRGKRKLRISFSP